MTGNELEHNSSSPWYIVRGCLVAIITVGIILSNTINLIVWKKNKRMPTATRLFLINLSTSDLLVGVFTTSLAIYPAFKGVWPYGDVWCQISGVIHGMSVSISIWSIAMVGIDRYFAATRPYDYKTLMSRKRSFIIVGCMWVVAFATYIAPIFTKRDFIYYKYKNYDAFCGLHWEYPLYCIITSIYIPLASAVVLVFTSFKIRMNLTKNKQLNNNSNSDSNPTSSDKHSKKMAAINKRALLILVTAAVVFFIFWGPYVILNITLSFTQNIHVSEEVQFSVMWIANTNSMVNVIVYSLTNKSFQDEARELLLKLSVTQEKDVNHANNENDENKIENNELQLNDIKIIAGISTIENI